MHGIENTATLSEIVGQYCLHLNSIYQPLAQISRGIIADNILYSIVLTCAFDMAPMKLHFSINPKEINGLGLNLLFICMWVQFINILTDFFPPHPKLALIHRTPPKPLVRETRFPVEEGRVGGPPRHSGFLLGLSPSIEVWALKGPLKLGNVEHHDSARGVSVLE